MTIDITHPAQDENLRKPYGHFEAVYDLDRDEFMEYLDDKIPRPNDSELVRAESRGKRFEQR